VSVNNQQNEQIPLISNHWVQKRLCWGRSMSWVGRDTI